MVYAEEISIKEQVNYRWKIIRKNGLDFFSFVFLWFLLCVFLFCFAFVCVCVCVCVCVLFCLLFLLSTFFFIFLLLFFYSPTLSFLRYFVTVIENLSLFKIWFVEL